MNVTSVDDLNEVGELQEALARVLASAALGLVSMRHVSAAWC